MTDEERTAVKTYVPRWQKERWASDAESLDMSQSEFLRSMVQAGRRNVNVDAEEGPSGDATPRGETSEEGFADIVRERLAEEGPLDWDGLLDEVTAGIEEELADTVETLDDRGDIQYKPREGGYRLVDE